MVAKGERNRKLALGKTPPFHTTAATIMQYNVIVIDNVNTAYVTQRQDTPTNFLAAVCWVSLSVGGKKSIKAKLTTSMPLRAAMLPKVYASPWATANSTKIERPLSMWPASSAYPQIWEFPTMMGERPAAHKVGAVDPVELPQ